jgi:hypothetical protein
MTTSTATPTTDRLTVATRTRIVAVLGALAASAACTTLLSLAALALGADPAFAPLGAPAYLTFAIAGTLAGLGGWALIVRVARRSARVLRVLVPTLLVLSFIPDLVLLFTGFIRGMTTVGVAALMLMHLVVVGSVVVAGRVIAPPR